MITIRLDNKRAQRARRCRSLTAILRLVRGLTSTRARRGIPRRSGNCHRLFAALGAATNSYTANALNQYSSITDPVNTVNPVYDSDGQQKSAKGKAPQQPDRDFEACARLNEHKSEERYPAKERQQYIITNGVWSFRWDAENRMVVAYSNDALLVVNVYDDQSRRIRKVTAQGTRTFLYDGWNPVRETIGASTNYYCWGTDLSGTMQGAGGVGGLLAVYTVNAGTTSTFHPCYDANGNIMAYVDELGIVRAEYAYDAFGQTISQGGDMASTFSHRFSTKYADDETGFYYYGFRFYSPKLGRWVNRDPIGEEGGQNLYGFVENNAVLFNDLLGTLTRPYNYYGTFQWRTVATTPREVFDFLRTDEKYLYGKKDAFYKGSPSGVGGTLYIGDYWDPDKNPSGYATVLAHEMVNALSYYFRDAYPGETHGGYDARTKSQVYQTGLHQLNLAYEWGMWASVRPDYLTCDEVKRRRDEKSKEYGEDVGKQYINSAYGTAANNMVDWICACRCGNPPKETFDSAEFIREGAAGLVGRNARVHVQSKLSCKNKKISGGLHVKLEVAF